MDNGEGSGSTEALPGVEAVAPSLVGCAVPVLETEVGYVHNVVVTARICTPGSVTDEGHAEAAPIEEVDSTGEGYAKPPPERVRVRW